MSIDLLIQEITPIYNAYQKGQGMLKPAALIELMWDIGTILEKYITLYNVAPHTLYRDIYGKSEGTKNVKQRSYITREFLGRSYRVKRIFKERKDIQKQLPKLSATNHFREAMP
jgi:hypothetical protein